MFICGGVNKTCIQFNWRPPLTHRLSSLFSKVRLEGYGNSTKKMLAIFSERQKTLVLFVYRTPLRWRWSSGMRFSLKCLDDSPQSPFHNDSIPPPDGNHWAWSRVISTGCSRGWNPNCESTCWPTVARKQASNLEFPAHSKHTRAFRTFRRRADRVFYTWAGFPPTHLNGMSSLWRLHFSPNSMTPNAISAIFTYASVEE